MHSMNDRDERSPRSRSPSALSALQQGRDCYARHAWMEAWQALSLADRQAPLGGADLELLATSAYLLGRDDDYLQALDRAYSAFLASDENRRAVRCAFWLGLRLSFRGESGRATGWFGRAHRLLERERDDCVEAGYLLLAVVSQQVAAGNLEAAYAAATRATEIGDGFAEADLSASARHLQGRVLIEQGEVARGLALLDEAMLAVAAGGLSPVITGLTYCSVIEGCQQAYALSRAGEWTDALTAWCAAQPEMVAFSGVCLAHRAEVLQLRGAWHDALAEARRAFERCQQARNSRAAAMALYQQGEIHRLRGEDAQAEEAYSGASRGGYDPQPGLALLRAVQGRLSAAASAIVRALQATTDPMQRAHLLPAYIEIMLQKGDVEAAGSACDELNQVAIKCASNELDGIAAAARAALALAMGDAQGALLAVRPTYQRWQQADAPYLLARARVLAGLACAALGDEEGSRLELDAARILFTRLGALPDLARIDALAGSGVSARSHGLTRRELQVLQLIADGKTNKAIAAQLVLSEKTIDRHVSNILAKLDVPSRTAATARAYQYQLIRSS
jgi:DNA-binding CsgD family transcriptional regulator